MIYFFAPYMLISCATKEKNGMPRIKVLIIYDVSIAEY